MQTSKFFLFFCTFLSALLCAEDDAKRVFKFRGGEQVAISIRGETEKPVEQMVTSDGLVSVTGCGVVPIGGLDLIDATDLIAKTVHKKLGMRDPQVAIAVISVSPRRAYITGEVVQPQAVLLPQDHDLKVGSALVIAGGTTDFADVTRIKLVRGGEKGKAVMVDGTQFAKPNTTNLGPVLRSGDVVIVPRSESVSVVGAVSQPGIVSRKIAQVPAGQPFRLSRAVAAAGGTEDKADVSAILVVRTSPVGKRQVNTYDMKAALKDGDVNQDPVLRDGDQIIVTPGEGITILGKVNAPGVFYPPPGLKLTLTRLVALAGGFAPHARYNAVSVIFKEHQGKPRQFNVKEMLLKGGMKEDPILKPGDVVFVGESAF